MLDEGLDSQEVGEAGHSAVIGDSSLLVSTKIRILREIFIIKKMVYFIDKICIYTYFLTRD